MNSHQITLTEEDLKNLVAMFNGLVRVSDLSGARMVIALHDKIMNQVSQISPRTETEEPVAPHIAP